MPTWTWAVPVIAIGLLVVALVAGVGIVVTLLCAAALRRCRDRFGASRRGHRPPGWRALRDARARGRGDSDRGLAHSLHGDRRRASAGPPAARHDLRRVDDHPERRAGRSQLAFAATASIALWAVFVFVQTVRHRDYFLPESDPANPEIHAEPPSTLHTWASFALLLVSLVAVVGLAKVLSPVIEQAVVAASAPKSLIGIAIAMLVLMPETSAAVRAARANRLQTSMNLAIGSALASIGLTIPVVAAASVVLGIPLVLGLDEAKDVVMLALTFVVSAVTLATGRTHVMQGAVHVVMFAAFLFLALVP